MRAADLADFQAYRSISELGQYQGWSPMSNAEALAFLTEMQQTQQFEPGKWVQFGIAEQDCDRLIGDIGVYVSADARFGEVGFTLEPNSQGRARPRYF